MVDGELVGLEDALDVRSGAGERSSNRVVSVARTDEVGEQVTISGGRLVGGGAGAAEGNGEAEPRAEEAEIVRVLGNHGLAGGEGLVGVVGDGEVVLRLGFEDVGGVVLIVIAGAGAVDRNDDEGVDGERIDVGDAIGGGDPGSVGGEKIGDGYGAVVGGGGSEGEVGDTGGGGAVADEAESGGVVLVAVELLVVNIALLGV